MSVSQKVLVIDDEPDIAELLEITLTRMGLETEVAVDVKGAIATLQQSNVDLVLTDLRLPDGDGMDIVHHIAEHQAGMPVAVITAHGNMDLAITAMKAGAFDFISKPVDINKLRNLIKRALKVNPGSARWQKMKIAGSTLSHGKSKAMLDLTRQVSRLAVSQAPVLILGESGTGKELAARQIHSLGPRSRGNFVAVNCGAIPSELMESEFFGHKKGAFTGAIENRNGFFQSADGGTLFLDEVADLPLTMQVKLLRAIQEKRIRPIGAQQEVDVDVRILSATHKNLAAMVEANEFRQDLFYRINVIQLDIPALRERHEDIPLLSTSILKRITRNYNLPTAEIDKAALQALNTYHFPGNIRELENILERAFAMCDNNRITVKDLQLRTKDAATPAALSAGISQRPKDMPLEDYLLDLERNAIEQALNETRWNRTAAAKKLGLSFRALRYRLKKLDLD